MRRGFTLIELVMVVVILGVLAATALPRFVDLSAQAKDSAAKGALGGIRAAVAIQYAQNAANGISPNIPSKIEGAMFADGQIPIEPLSNSRDVTYSSAPPKEDGVGWRYDPVNGRVWINDVDYSDY